MPGKIPILKFDEFLVVSIQVDLHDSTVSTFQDELIRRVHKHAAKAVLIDVSTVELIDSYMGRILSNIASLLKIMDAATMIVGMQPAVAITLVELGLSLPGVHTAMNVEQGMAQIRTLLARAKDQHE